MNKKEKTVVVILAGGSTPKKLENIASSRATIKVNDRYILSYIVDAFRNAGFTRERMIAVVPFDVAPALEELNIPLVSATNNIVENMVNGLDYFDLSEYDNVIYSTADIPLITAEAINDFIEKSLDSEASFTYPIIEKAVCERAFPNNKRTYAKVADGEFTGGNLFFASIDFMRGKSEIIDKIYSYRKTPLKLAGILGTSFIMKYISGKLTIKDIESKVESMIESPVKAIITSYPEIGFDVDKLSDLESVEAYLKAK